MCFKEKRKPENKKGKVNRLQMNGTEIGKSVLCRTEINECKSFESWKS